MPVTGVITVDVEGRTRNRHQVFVNGSNDSYVITVNVADSEGGSAQRSPANNTINGVSGVPIIISGRYDSIVITPPDGNNYTYSVLQLDS